MNRAEAAAVLSVDPDASPEDARRAYQELFTEHQVRLTNAPTPSLRSLYQARLLELDEAKDVLLAPSMGDADTDLPTDQPSIPSHIAREPAAAPTPTRREDKPPSAPNAPPASGEPPSEKKNAVADGQSSPGRKGSKTKTVFTFFAGVLAVVVVAAVVIPKLLSDNGGSSKDASASYSDRLPGLRENLTVARVEFGRGDYDAANRALLGADSVYSDIIPHASGNTAISQIKAQLDSLHGKVTRACDALKKVAERHPGEPTCKTL